MLKKKNFAEIFSEKLAVIMMIQAFITLFISSETHTLTV